VSSQRRAVVRSYQRLFVPDRRIYAIDGRTIPVPGGVSLRWLGYAAVTAAIVLLIGARHPVVMAAGAAIAYRSAARLGPRRAGIQRAAVTAAALIVASLVVDVVDWPPRFVVLPAVTASALTQLAPDGRSAPRYLLSLARVRVAGRRRLGVALPVAGTPTPIAPRIAVVADVDSPRLSRARITGPCRLRLAEPVLVRRGRRGRRVTPVASERRRLGAMVDALVLERGRARGGAAVSDPARGLGRTRRRVVEQHRARHRVGVAGGIDGLDRVRVSAAAPVAASSRRSRSRARAA
jgi:hypothetical protein